MLKEVDYNNSTVYRLLCAPVAQLVEHRVVTREVVSSTRPDQHSGSYNNRVESASFEIISANG